MVLRPVYMDRNMCRVVALLVPVWRRSPDGSFSFLGVYRHRRRFFLGALVQDALAVRHWRFPSTKERNLDSIGRSGDYSGASCRRRSDRSAVPFAKDPCSGDDGQTGAVSGDSARFCAHRLFLRRLLLRKTRPGRVGRRFSRR